MKKLMTMMLFVVLGFGTAIAQHSRTITGYVVDKNGNPLAGAEVMAPGGGASSITDSDGSFTLDVHVLLKKVVASYPGMVEKTIGIENTSNLVITLKPDRRLRGFINVVGACGIMTEKDDYDGDHYSYASYGVGLMGGQLGKWGWYLKGLYNGFDSENGLIWTAGAIKRLGKSSTHLYLGVGVAAHSMDNDCGVAIDLGAIFKIGQHLNITTGLNYSRSSYGDYESYGYFSVWDNDVNLNIGVGYIF